MEINLNDTNTIVSIPKTPWQRGLGNNDIKADSPTRYPVLSPYS